MEVKDNLFEQKVIDSFSQLNISISKSDVEDCHWLGKSNTIVRFINQKFCKDTLEKSLRLISTLTIQSLALILRINYLYKRT